MEKKVRYLMLLLCLFLFPIRVFALEGELEGTENKQDETVEVTTNNNENNEINENLEDLQKIEDPNEVLLEEVSNEAAGEEDPATDKFEGEITDPTNENTENVENGESAEPTTSEETTTGEETTTEELTTVRINGVDTHLASGKEITFGATSAESDKYTVLSEEWYYAVYQDSKYHSSDPAKNESYQSEELYFETPVADGFYDYSIILKVAEGYSLPEQLTVIVDGTEYEAYAWANDYNHPENNEYFVDVMLQVTATNSEATYIDSLALENVVKDAYIGQSPLYGATSATEHFNTYAELWEYYVTEEKEDGTTAYYYYANASIPEMIDEYSEEFTTFEAGHKYYYRILLTAEDNYRLASSSDSFDPTSYNVTINGEKADVEVFGWLGDDGLYYYEIYFGAIEPTEIATYEVVENADPTLELEELEDTTIGVDGDFSTFENAYVDGNLVEEENYTVDTQNSAVTFVKSFLQTLAKGVHNVALYFTDGHIANTTLTINGPEETTAPEATTSQETTSSTNYEVVQTSYEKVEEETKEKEVKEEEKEEKEKEKSNIGLIIFLIILILIAIAIPVTVYRKKQD